MTPELLGLLAWFTFVVLLAKPVDMITSFLLSRLGARRGDR